MSSSSPRSSRKRHAKESQPVTETERVHVSVRVRPLNKRERIGKKKLCLRLDADSNQLSIVKEVKLTLGEVPPFSEAPTERHSHMNFQFDHVFWSVKAPAGDLYDAPERATQEDVFRTIGTPLVNHAFNGFNSCLFAYGQTGSGKTYTMMGADTAMLEGDGIEGRGVAPRIFQEIFRRKDEIEGTKGGGNSTWAVEIGYVEVYNERVSDLLACRAKPAEEVFVDVREHPSRGVFLEGQRLVKARSFSDVIKCVEAGNLVRHTASTKMNNRSSRSHAIIMVLLHEERLLVTKNQAPIRTLGKSSRMNLVDLAGSERVSQSEVEGVRFTEATHINLSLTTLGRVIDMLADIATKGAKTCSTTPPFRDAKLTFILKDSLGGNSKTMMVATVSPSALSYEETLGTLRYASRARDIVNVAKVNEDPRARRIRELEEQMQVFRSKLQLADPAYVAELEEKIKLIESEARNRAADLQALERERAASELRERILKSTQAERADLERQADELKRQVDDSRRQAAEMQEQNARLKEEQARREKRLLDDVECARAEARVKEQVLAQAKRDLERERTERENAVRFMQHYKEKLNDALSHSKQSTAEKIALEEVNTTLNCQLKELEEEQAQCINGLLKKLEDSRREALHIQAKCSLMIAEKEEQRSIMFKYIQERERLYRSFSGGFKLACAKPSPGGASEGESSTGGNTRSSPAASEPLSANQQGEERPRADLADAVQVDVSFQEADGQSRHADPAQASPGAKLTAVDVLQALGKVDQADKGYYDCVEKIKTQAKELENTKQNLDELIERFFADSLSRLPHEGMMADQLSDVELAKDALEVTEQEMQMLNERFETCAQRREVAIRNLERQIQAMLDGKFEVRLLFPGDRDVDGLQEGDLPIEDPSTPSAAEFFFDSPSNDMGAAGQADTSNMRTPLSSPQQENASAVGLSSIQQSILESFPVSAQMADFLSKTIH